MKKQYFIVVASCITMLFYNCSNDKNNKRGISAPAMPINFGVVNVLNENSASSCNRVWTNQDKYDVINEIIGSNKSDSQKINLLNITTANIKSSLSNLINTKDFTIQDSIDFLTSIDTSNYTFDCAKLNNVRCISVADYLTIFKSKNSKKNWSAFSARFGSNISYMSLPLFNKQKDRAIIIVGFWAYKMGNKHLIMLSKENNKWTIKKQVNIEIV